MDKLEPIRAVFRQCGLYNHAADDLLCERLAEAMTPKTCAGDLDRAIAAAREALAFHYKRAEFSDTPCHALDAIGSLDDLLAAIDAARGEAVATVQTITSLVGETRKCIIGPAEVIDSLPVGTAVYAAPPAAAVPEGYALEAVAELAAALDAVDGVMQDAYNRGHQVCCGQGYSECCGNPIVEWEPADNAIMSGLQPVHATLAALLAAANKENTNG